ncbi:hypothetical protein NDU88_003311 [Pleurodeles waltl]|uniref:Uncharacterized protein n=1 Tax=Pleurodeles waltl TaxID=8319 RepID=A0AAV7VDN1_PLEWA|nr:hypothetical protein NDU88_003311 [Pleurodeles waltl]
MCCRPSGQPGEDLVGQLRSVRILGGKQTSGDRWRRGRKHRPIGLAVVALRGQRSSHFAGCFPRTWTWPWRREPGAPEVPVV